MDILKNIFFPRVANISNTIDKIKSRKENIEKLENMTLMPKTGNISNEILDTNSPQIVAYTIFSAIYIISFVCIYNKNLALLGSILLYFINIIVSIFLAKDLLISKRSEQLITYIIIAVLAMNMVSSSFVMMTIQTLHTKNVKDNKNIKLSNKNRDILSVYFTMFICTIVFIGILALFYFIESPGEPFLNTVFIGKEYSPKILIAITLFKIALIGTSLGLSSYMVYLGTEFSKLKRKML